MVQAGDSVGRRAAARRLPGVEAEVMVIAAGGHEEDVAGRPPAGDAARLLDDVEAQDADVEVADAVDVGGAQVDVADARARIDRALRALARLDRALRPAAHERASMRSSICHGSRTAKPPAVGSTATSAAASRSRTSATCSAVSSSIVQCSTPAVWDGAGGTPRPRQTLKPRWW